MTGVQTCALPILFFGLFGFLFVVGGFYGIREIIEPGYWHAVWENELGGRYLTTIENHHHGFGFYFVDVIIPRNSFWNWFVLGGIVLGISSVHQHINKLTAYLSFAALGYWFVISTAQTKLLWYAIPLYPILAFLCAFSFHWMAELIDSPSITKTLKYPVVSWFILILIFQIPYRQIISTVYMTEETVDFLKISYPLREAVRGNQTLQNVSILYSNYETPLYFYTRQLENQNVHFKKIDEIHVGDTILLSEPVMNQTLAEKFELRILYESGPVRLQEIISSKSLQVSK